MKPASPSGVRRFESWRSAHLLALVHEDLRPRHREDDVPRTAVVRHAVVLRVSPPEEALHVVDGTAGEVPVDELAVVAEGHRIRVDRRELVADVEFVVVLHVDRALEPIVPAGAVLVRDLHGEIRQKLALVADVLADDDEPVGADAVERDRGIALPFHEHELLLVEAADGRHLVLLRLREVGVAAAASREAREYGHEKEYPFHDFLSLLVLVEVLQFLGTMPKNHCADTLAQKKQKSQDTKALFYLLFVCPSGINSA